MSDSKPTYQPLKNDGALYRCKDCNQQGTHSEMWYVTTPNGYKGVFHKECIDPDWIATAEFVNHPI